MMLAPNLVLLTSIIQSNDIPIIFHYDRETKTQSPAWRLVPQSAHLSSLRKSKDAEGKTSRNPQEIVLQTQHNPTKSRI